MITEVFRDVVGVCLMGKSHSPPAPHSRSDSDCMVAKHTLGETHVPHCLPLPDAYFTRRTGLELSGRPSIIERAWNGS